MDEKIENALGKGQNKSDFIRTAIIEKLTRTENEKSRSNK